MPHRRAKFARHRVLKPTIRDSETAEYMLKNRLKRRALTIKVEKDKTMSMTIPEAEFNSPGATRTVTSHLINLDEFVYSSNLPLQLMNLCLLIRFRKVLTCGRVAPGIPARTWRLRMGI